MKLLRAHVHPWLRKNADLLGAYGSIAGLVLAPVILIGGVVGYLQLKDALDTPDVTLLFGNPEEPRFWVQNPSSKLAREALYELRIFNLGVVADDGAYLNLEIPVGSVDFVRPGRGFGPWTIRSVARQGRSIQKGHYLFGHAQVQCPNCETVREYWIFVHVGNTGWYAEAGDGETSDAMEDLLGVARGDPDYLRRILEIVPPDRRVSMATYN